VADFEQSRLLERARKAREDAALTRLVASQISVVAARDSLLKQAAAQEAEATALEQLASSITPPPVIERHEQVQQAQQVQLTQPDQDDAGPDEPPGSS
jgi:hypothetical protein